jgi:hypothetical protein
MKTKKNKPGEAVVPAAYRAFIVNALRRAGGVINEVELDRQIREQYAAYWGKTDRDPWGSVPPGKTKWKQNVASAKAALDHTGEIIRLTLRHRVPCKSDPKKLKVRVEELRVYLGPRYRHIIAAVRQRDRRRRVFKPSYEQLEQPVPVYVVPTSET